MKLKQESEKKMNAIAPRASTAVASLANLKSGLQNVASTIVTAGGDPFLRLLTDGTWVYGADNVEVQEGSLWALNPFSIMHGWVSWTDHPGKQANEIVGEVMVPAGQPLPPQTELRDTGWPWTQQLSVQLRCMSGEDIGTQVLYKTGSVGGMNAVKKLINEIMAHISEDEDTPVAVVQMGTDHYMHKKWGKTYTPIFDIVKWIALEDDAAVAEASARPAGDEPEPAPTRTRRAAPAETKAAKPAEEEPATKATPTADDRRAALLAELERLEKGGKQDETEENGGPEADADQAPAPRRRRR